ncbi:MAG: hypothetical protein JJE46_01960 [Acidimicrobiia bacterium]|nr:hypothetical protein [Acidimicrobiia bacterium]
MSGGTGVRRMMASGAVIIVGLVASACSDGGSGAGSKPSGASAARRPETPKPAIGSGRIAAGTTGSFEFTGAPSLVDRPLRVWYDAPDDLITAKVLVVMHGQQRNGEEYRDTWIPYARAQNALLIVPEFPDDDYPGSNSYNLGNIVDDNGTPRPEREWSYSVIEPLFDGVRAETGTESEGYYLYGHSAGAQFVHRFILLEPTNRVLRAVSANAGWYTAPEADVEFPYGLEDSPVTDAGLRRSLGAPLVVLLGEDDVETDTDNLRQTPEAERQGSNRLTRGRFFYEVARKRAAALETPFTWEIQTVPGAEHSDEEMAPAAADALFG